MKYILAIVIFFLTQNLLALSQKDIKLYKSIFKDYRNGDFSLSDNDIAKLDDKILMGHVQALKLLHPTKHRSSFEELRNWLEKYHSQYEAKRIYKLGIKRKPIDVKKPKKNNYPSLDKIFTENLFRINKKI